MAPEAEDADDEVIEPARVGRRHRLRDRAREIVRRVPEPVRHLIITIRDNSVWRAAVGHGGTFLTIMDAEESVEARKQGGLMCFQIAMKQE